MKLWTGRFTKNLDEDINDFNSSIRFDCVMFKEDIQGSIAHATMLGKTGIISQEDSAALVSGLEGIVHDLEGGRLEIDTVSEDIHMFVEEILTKRIGDTGKRLHTARSRNDQVALDLRMYLKNRMSGLESIIVKMIDIITYKAEENLQTVMPGYTHMQIAQPVTFAHHLMAYVQMFLRDLDRMKDCRRRTDFMPLGSGALASTTYPIDRELTCRLLGFADVTQNSMDAVSDRDFCIELASMLSIFMVHLSRFCEEIIIWSSSEFKFIELDDAYATGSSIMPQKKNPDVAELIRGKSGRVFGSLTTLLTVMKGLPLAYNKDMQEDKQAIFDCVNTVESCIKAFTPMLDTFVVNKENMRKAAGKGFINATDCADYLVRKGMPFREAYKITGELVRFCVEAEHTLETLPMKHYRNHSNLFNDDIYTAIDLENCVNNRNVQGGPSPNGVVKQISEARKNLGYIIANY